MVESILPLSLRGASVVRSGTRLVGPVDMEVDGSGVIIVVGPNGSGKTSLLRLMHGLERAASGEVVWAVQRNEARNRQAFVFQTPILMRRRVLDCIAYPLIVQGTPRAKARNWLPNGRRKLDLAMPGIIRPLCCRVVNGRNWPSLAP